MFSFKRGYRFLTIFALAALSFTACKKDDDGDTPSGPVYTNTIYDFENVNYSGQTARLSMLQEIGSKISSGTTSEISAQVLKNMFANVGNEFSDDALNASGKQLQDKTADDTIFVRLFEEAALASKIQGTASGGQAGVIENRTGRKYLVSDRGLEYNQVILKGIMGATFYNQAVSSYLTEAKIGDNVDNSTVTPGNGTPMEHHWDEAFGYFGVPKNYPVNDTAKYWGSYANQVSIHTNSDVKLMDAFVVGRAAISNKDMKTKNEKAEIIRTEWEKLVAASAVHELNAAMKDPSDMGARLHYISEAIGFILGLKYNPQQKISDAQVDLLLEKLNFRTGSLYQITDATMKEVIDTLSAVYGFEDYKYQL